MALAAASAQMIFGNGFEAAAPVTSGGGGVNYLWFGDDGQGSTLIRGRLPVVEAAGLVRLIDAYVERSFGAGHAPD